jgi:D-serine dehydratase
MSIDERLDRLTARHEALLESAKRLARFQPKRNEAFSRSEQMQRKIGERLAQVAERVDSLAKIALAKPPHSGLEGGLN